MPKSSSKNHQDPSTSSGTSPAELNVKPFITVKDLATRLHVKPNTIYDWSRGRTYDRIPQYPISRKGLLFRWSEVAAWVAAQRVGVA